MEKIPIMRYLVLSLTRISDSLVKTKTVKAKRVGTE